MQPWDHDYENIDDDDEHFDNDDDGNYHDESNGNDDGILTFTMKMIQSDRRPFNFLPILAAASTGQVLSRCLLIYWWCWG